MIAKSSLHQNKQILTVGEVVGMVKNESWKADSDRACTDSYLREVAEYLQSISRSGGFLCMDDILGYFKRKHKVIRNAVNNS